MKEKIYAEKLEKTRTVNRKPFYNFKCRCGKIFESRGDYAPQSCGCVEKIKKAKQFDIAIENGWVFLDDNYLSLRTKDKTTVKCPKCEKTYKTTTQKILNGTQKSCYSCKGAGLIKGFRNIGGVRKHEAYSVLDSMKQRCYNESSESFKHYGAKGVKICDEWRYSYVAFCSWADNNGFKEGLSIDRIDPYGNYEPSNCRWIPLEQQYEKKRLMSTNKSGARCVWFDKDRNYYEVGTVINSIGKKINIGYFKTFVQARLAYTMFVKINDREKLNDLSDIDNKILDWGIERKLIKFDKIVELTMLEEEIDELHDAKDCLDTHETIDAYMDIYVVFTQTLAKAGISKIDLATDKDFNKWFILYSKIENTIENLGYDFNKCMNQTIKEISSRKGRIIDGKFEKFKDGEDGYQKPYKADYSLCTIKGDTDDI